MFSDFLKALAQLSDRRFLKVVAFGIALSFALLFAVYAGFVQIVDWLTPDTLTLPWVGEVTWVQDLLGWGSILLMIGLSVFLMVPVASAFTGLFLDDVAQAVEKRHYPDLPSAPRLAWMDALIDSVNFFGVLVVVNVVALILYAFVGPFAPLMFWAVNGYLLGREYFQMAAMRRIGRQGARDLRRRFSGQIWIAGMLMAAPLSLPLVNLVIPVLGAATFTHLFHRLNAKAAT
ncbi:EI24 domain-containing protein [Albidovulum aquaemixtae]|uniref:EI24 domain-containing protein n=1 Tax=Albidovulum aquaemixtae TaxID=1542388 RepID=UPI000D5568CC|nr:EI24 domain-containing protein [Defluviimonas aquaemixtae]